MLAVATRPPLDRSPAVRPFAALRTEDQWRRASHHGTSLQPGTWAVQLAWETEPVVDDAAGDAPTGAGLAFDPWCRLYHSVPEAGRVERVLWAEQDPLRPLAEGSPPVDLFAAPEPAPMGDFAPVGPTPSAVNHPRGLAVDADGRLFVAEAGTGRVLIYDLMDRHLYRRASFSLPAFGGGRAVDLATDGQRVFVLLTSPSALAELDARSGPSPLVLPGEGEGASRLAVRPAGGLYLLAAAGTALARVVPAQRPDAAFEVPFATDLEFLDASELVVARRPGEDFLRFGLHGDSLDALSPLKGRGYDGRGIVRTPDGRIGFWTSRGFRHAVAARVRYLQSGRVVTYRLDSGAFQTVWGRVFLDACIPNETRVRLHCVALDEPEGPELARLPPANSLGAVIHRPDLSPPMPPALFARPTDGALPQSFHRRETGRELPWAPPASDDPFETYEAPVLAEPGRYLWITLELLGDRRTTPRIKAVRVEHPSHDLLRRLPKIYSRDRPAADFLRRYLSGLEGTLADLDARAFARRALLDPCSTPAELLPWLGSFVGLVLDERWPEEVRRRLIEESIWLWRFRGTIPGLTRFLEIYLGRPVQIIEHYRVRGLGGAVVGDDADLPSSPVLGAGFRVGGALGTEQDVGVLEGQPVEDAFATHAHRFSVVIPAALDSEQEDVVRHILDQHRPAHTLYDLCTVDAGMRVGIALYTELTTLVGRSGGFLQLQVGGTPLGRNAVLGRPGPGARAGASYLGGDSRVG